MDLKLHLRLVSTGARSLQIKQTIHSVCSQSLAKQISSSLPTLLVLVDCLHSSVVVAEQNQDGLHTYRSVSLVLQKPTSACCTLVLDLYSTSTMQTIVERMHMTVLVPSTPSLVLLKRSVLILQRIPLFCPYKALLALPLLPTGLLKVQSRQRAQQSRDRQILGMDLAPYSTSRLVVRESPTITAASRMFYSLLWIMVRLHLHQSTLSRFSRLQMKQSRVVQTKELSI